jgi:acyl-CoA dehydrogenase
MIDFEPSAACESLKAMVHAAAEALMRPVSRQYDENEHAIPWDFINYMWQSTQGSDTNLAGKKPATGEAAVSERNVQLVLSIEELSWGDAGIYLSMAGPGLGGAAVAAAGTAEQKARFLSRFRTGKPKWAAMAITEPSCGSDSSAIHTSAVRDGDHWVLNGAKIFCTAGHKALVESAGFVVVWATVDKSAGRSGIKAFVVEHDTPGITVAKLEHKLGIRASDTAMLILEDCRVPLDNVLGSAEIPKTSEEGFKGVMATFDATRPAVAASAIGIGRAAVEFVRETLEEAGRPIRYGVAASNLTAVERDFMEMESLLQGARLLTWRAAWMMDRGLHNNLEASMAKAKAGLAVTHITQKAVEILGPLGYSRALLVEKWMRDAKINDIFEGTQQINMLIVSRRILGYSSRELS